MVVLKNIPIILFSIIIFSQAQAVGPSIKPDVQVEEEDEILKRFFNQIDREIGKLKNLYPQLADWNTEKTDAKGLSTGKEISENRLIYNHAVFPGRSPGYKDWCGENGCHIQIARYTGVEGPYMKTRIFPLKKGTMFSVIARVITGNPEVPELEQKINEIIHLAAASAVQESDLQVEPGLAQLRAAFEAQKFAHSRDGFIALVQEIGNKEPESFLIEQLELDNRARRCQAALALEILGDRRGIPAIVRELNDTSYRPATKIRSDGGQDQKGQIRQDHYYAALLLGISGDKRAVPALVEATRDEEINYQAAISLGQIGDMRAVPALRAMLEKYSNEPFVRLFAGYGLAMLNDEEGLRVVINTLNNQELHWVDRRHAIRALGELRDKQAVPHLIVALKDDHPNIRVSAARALGAIGDASALLALEQALKDKTETKANTPTTVSKAAAEAIAQIRAEGRKAAVQIEGEEGWGKTVNGVQCRLRTERTLWKMDEVPRFSMDLRNRGERRLQLPELPDYCLVRVDGRWFFITGYEPGKEVGLSTRVLDFLPGQQRTGIPLELSDKWETMLDSEVALGAYVRHDGILTGPGLRSRLKLTPGKHTIRVSFIVTATGMRVGINPLALLQVVSNPVEIVILPEQKPAVQVGREAVDGLQVSITMEKTTFAMDEPITVKWQIKNVSQEDKTIIWHKLHYSPVVFEIGKSGGKKYIREDSRRMFNSAIPEPPEKLILKPGETKEAIFDLRRFGLHSSAERGTYEVTGLYSPQKASRLADYWLKRPEFKDCFTGQISSAQLKITITENVVWLQNQLRKGKFWDRLQAARRLSPIIGNEEVLTELEKIYPSENTRHMVWLVDHMAEFGDTSHVPEVLMMYETDSYAPYWDDYGADMLVFLLKWGQDRGVRYLSEYLEAHKETTEGTARRMTKRNFLKALTKGSYWYFDFEIGENALPLLILTLDEKTIEGSLTVKSGSEVKVRWCDSAALAIQKMLKHDWGFKLNLSEKERDEIISQMQAELAERAPDFELAGLSEKLNDKWLLDAKQSIDRHSGKFGIYFDIKYAGITRPPEMPEDIVISHRVKSLTMNDISIEMNDFAGEVTIWNKTGFGRFFLPGKIDGLQNLKPGKYPVRLVYEGDIYKANQSDRPLGHWQVELQEEIKLTDLILKKDISHTQADFESLSVEISGMWIAWQKPMFRVTGNGLVEFSMNKSLNEPGRYKSTFNLKQEHLISLDKLLEKTGWLTHPGANVQPVYTDASRIDLTLERRGKVAKAWCHDRNPEPYGSLVNFLKRIYRQEYLLNRMTEAGERERIDAFREIDQELRAAKDEPIAVHPTPVLDYQRFVPIFIEVINNAEDNYRDVIATSLNTTTPF